MNRVNIDCTHFRYATHLLYITSDYLSSQNEDEYQRDSGGIGPAMHDLKNIRSQFHENGVGLMLRRGWIGGFN